MFDLFSKRRREEERKRQGRVEAALAAGARGTPERSRSAYDDSPMNPASPSGMILSPLSRVSPLYGGHAAPDTSSCHSYDSSSSYSGSSSCSSSSDSGSSGGGGD